MVDDEVIGRLVERWEDARDQGTPLSPEELCQASPHLLTELTRRIGQLLAIEKVLNVEATAADQGISAEEPAPEVPGYEVVRLIETGGMGKVYEARHQILGTTRAIKVMRASGVSAEALERFRREMTVGARFEHEHIVPVYEAGLLADGSPFFVMPLIRGGSLKAQMARFQQDLPAGVALMTTVCRAVGYANRLGIVHRDLKPGNILLTEEDKPLVADFGIAKLLSEKPDAPATVPSPVGHDQETPVEATTGTPITQTGAIIGTWAYLSPEAVRGLTTTVNERSDVWALGVVLYQLVTGAFPFPAKEQLDLAVEITGKDPPPPPGDATLSRIVMRCLRKEQAERYPTANALADDLEAWLAGRPPRGVTPSWGYRLRWQARRWWKVAAGLTLLLSLGLALQAFYPREASQRERFLTAVKANLEKLRRGERVTLIGPGVAPVHDLRFGNGMARTAATLPEGAVAFASDGPARWELLPEIPVPNGAYRVEAEIAHTSAYPGEYRCGGIALAGSDVPTSGGIQHAFVFCGLTERGNLMKKFAGRNGPPSGAVFLTAVLVGDDPRHPSHWTTMIPLERRASLIPPAGPNLFPPRSMAVEVSPDDFSASRPREPKPFGVLDQDELQSTREWWLQRSRIQFLDKEEHTHWFPPEGPLDIVTRDSEITVTRLEVIPLGN